jgi:5-methylcytosine-specific restriction endonuclease McrA
VPQDFAEAVKWFHKAAEQGHVEAQLVLGGKAYARGIGVSQNRVEAMKWLHMAAEQGYPYAQAVLGIAYQYGGLSSGINLVEAYKWTVLATQTGVDKSRERDHLAEQMTPSQIEEGQRLTSIEALKIKNKPSCVNRTAELNRQRKEIQAVVNRDRAPTKNVPQERQTRMAISSQVRREVWRRDGGSCVKCGSRRNLEYDHIVPVSKGGSNTARNVELLCETCNRSKSATIQ